MGTDIIDFITAEKPSSEPFIWRTEKELCEAIGMVQSTLNEVLKRSTKLLKTVTGAGRAKKTGWTTVALFIQYAIELIQAAKKQYRTQMKQVVQEYVNDLEIIVGYEVLMIKLDRLFEALSPPSLHENKIRGSG